MRFWLLEPDFCKDQRKKFVAYPFLCSYLSIHWGACKYSKSFMRKISKTNFLNENKIQITSLREANLSYLAVVLNFYLIEIVFCWVFCLMEIFVFEWLCLKELFSFEWLLSGGDCLFLSDLCCDLSCLRILFIFLACIGLMVVLRMSKHCWLRSLADCLVSQLLYPSVPVFYSLLEPCRILSSFMGKWDIFKG